jgi:hypothetical protein
MKTGSPFALSKENYYWISTSGYLSPDSSAILVDKSASCIPIDLKEALTFAF